MLPLAAKQFHSAVPSFAVKNKRRLHSSRRSSRTLLFSLNLFLSLHNFSRLGRTVSRNRRNIRRSHAANPKLLPQFRINARKDVLVLFQEGPNILPALANTLALVAVPRAAFV